jgi:hypothetical protein
MRDHTCLPPASPAKRRRLAEIGHRARRIAALWTLILGGCAMTLYAVATMLAPGLTT